MFPHERIKRLFQQWQRKLLIWVGHDIYPKEFILTPTLYLVYAAETTFIFFCFYSMAFYGLRKGMETYTLFCIAVEVRDCTRSQSFLQQIIFFSMNKLGIKMYANRYRAIILEMVLKIISIYEQNSPKSERRRLELCTKFANYTEIIFLGGMVLYTISVTTYLLPPLYIYLTEQRVELILPVFIPGVDENTDTGKVIHYTFHLTCIILAFFGSTSSDFTFTMIIINAPVMAKILGINVGELNEMMAEKKPDPLMIKFKFRNILLIYREMAE